MRTISRDSFARVDFVRRQETSFSVDRTPDGNSFGERLNSCEWCGTVKYTKNGHPFLYRYGSNSDSVTNRTHFDDKRFCCLSCRSAYYDRG